MPKKYDPHEEHEDLMRQLAFLGKVAPYVVGLILVLTIATGVWSYSHSTFW